MTVSTSVPKYRNGAWEADADAMDMNLSDFIRTRVQAGSRGFDLTEPEITMAELQDQLVSALWALDCLTLEEIVEALPQGASEEDLEVVLERLQERGEVLVLAGGRYVLNDG